MDVNENPHILEKRVALETFASKLAPTGGLVVFWRRKKAPAIARRGLCVTTETQCPPR